MYVEHWIVVLSLAGGIPFGLAAALARLGERHSAILRTDQDGLSTVRSDGRKLYLDSMLWHPQSAADVFNWALALNLE